MAKKKEEVKVKKVVKPQRQKIIIAECRNPLFGKEIPYRVLYTEKVASKEIAETRLKEKGKSLEDICGDDIKKYNDEPIDRYANIFQFFGYYNVIISWIKDGFPVKEEELAHYLTTRFISRDIQYS